MNKKIYFLLIFMCLAFLNTSAQVSDDFYAYFKKIVTEKKALDYNYYRTLSEASAECFDLTKDIYLEEIKRFNERNISDSAAVSLIPREVMTRFFKSDYELLFCPNLSEYTDALNFYSEKFCDCYTPQYNKIDKRSLNSAPADLIRKCNEQLTSDETFKSVYRQKLDKATIDPQAMSSCAAAYISLHCPVMLEDLKEIPSFAATKNKLRSYIVSQRWDISEAFKKAIITNDVSDVSSFFANKQAEDLFVKKYKKFKTPIDRLRAGKAVNHIDWGVGTITQTFATLTEKGEVSIQFRIVYQFKQEQTRLKVTATDFLTANEIKDSANVIEKIKNAQNPPDAVDPNDKPDSPKPSGR